MKEFQLLGACGLYCGACLYYKPNVDRINKSIAEKDKAKENMVVCEGCRSGVLTEFCSDCDLRECNDKKGIPHCGMCPDYPCKELKSFQTDGKRHHVPALDNLYEIKRQGPENWLSEQKNRWQCSCGNSYSWYEENCTSCGKPLASYSK